MKLSVLWSAILLTLAILGGRAVAAEPKPEDLVAELQKKNQAEVDKVIDSLKNYGGSSWVADALGKLKDPWAVEPLLTLLVDSDPDVRKHAACALGAIGDPRAIGPLIAALGDESSDVREAAEGALGTSGPAAAATRPSPWA
jgi:HEAT repeat protein